MIDNSMHLRRVFWTASLLIAFASIIQAQPDGPPPDGPTPGFQPGTPPLPNVENDLKKLTKLLALSAGQQAQVQSILTDERARMQTALQKPEASETASSPEAALAAHAAFKSIRNDANARIAALLTADQAAKFAAWQKKQGEAAADDDMPPPPDGDGPPPDVGGPPPDGGGPPGGGPPGL